MVILLAMDDERKPKEDLKEGLGLIFRAAKGAVKQVDIGKIDKELDKAISQVGRVVSNVGRVVGDEIGRMANNPPWQKGQQPAAADAAKGEDATAPQDKKPDEESKEGEGQVHASDKPSGDKGDGGN
jgi:hypothetical protein